MKEFFNVISIDAVLELAGRFDRTEVETAPLDQGCGRVLARDLASPEDVPGFARSTMDGYAVAAASTFGASEGIPAMVDLAGRVEMGKEPDFDIGPNQAAVMPTGGMLPKSADSVVMVEHTEKLDDSTIEIYKSVAPLANVLEPGDDFKKSDVILQKGVRLRPQDLAVAAAAGIHELPVHARPVVEIISTGDEVVPADEKPGPGKIRDMNSHALTGLCIQSGAVPKTYGIIKDDRDALFSACEKALKECHMLLVSGGSSVGSRDHTVEIMEKMDDSEILVHGVSISPGKPTILAKIGSKAMWGLPGHVVSAMVVFHAMVDEFIGQISGCTDRGKNFPVKAVLARNVPSKQGRTDYIRVKINDSNGILTAHPIFGKSGVIRTMVEADGLIKVGINEEGLDAGAEVAVDLFSG